MPEEFWRNDAGSIHIKQTEASADLPPEVIDFDNQIPLIAGNGADRRVHPPPGFVEKVHDHLEREAELHDQLQHQSVPHFEVLAEHDAERKRLRAGTDESSLRWEVADFAKENAESKAAAAGASVSAGAEHRTHRNFLPEGERTSRTGVSGPSFLGLNDDPNLADDYEENKPNSHLGRNVALAILAIIMIIAATQWRSIRDYALAYMQNGSMQYGKQHEKQDSSTDTSSSPVPPTTSAKAGTPQSIAGNTNDRLLPVQQAASAPKLAQSDPVTAGSKQPSAMSGRATDAPVSVTETPAATGGYTRRLRTFPPDASSGIVPATSATPGADEMHRAAIASDAQVRAAWLWRAVGKGNPQAPVELAKMYQQGNGVARSCDQAQVLLRSAAAKGNTQAKIDLEQIRIRGGCSAQ
jgi:hypothetical protein